MIKGKTAPLLVASKGIGLTINTEKTTCMIMSRDQDAEQYHNIKMVNSFCETVSQFRYLQTSAADPNCIHEEIKSWNVC
jgi:uncharacterized membrane protein YjjP (DUF1212 family)